MYHGQKLDLLVVSLASVLAALLASSGAVDTGSFYCFSTPSLMALDSWQLIVDAMAASLSPLLMILSSLS